MAEVEDPSDDSRLQQALRDRLEQGGDPGAVIVGYVAVVEVMTPDLDGPWLKVLKDGRSTSWAQVGRARALSQQLDHVLDAGWEPEGDDD